MTVRRKNASSWGCPHVAYEDILTSGCTNQRGAGQNRECTNPHFRNFLIRQGFIFPGDSWMLDLVIGYMIQKYF